MGLFSKMFRSPREVDERFTQLRQRLLQVTPVELKLAPGAPHDIFGIVMETGIMDGPVATFGCLADGTVSLYLSTGGGVIGAGQHESVRSAGMELLRVTNEYATDYIAACAPGVRSELPSQGRVHFHLLTYGGIYHADCEEGALAAEEDAFAHLFGNCHTVMAEVRQVAPH